MLLLPSLHCSRLCSCCVLPSFYSYTYGYYPSGAWLVIFCSPPQSKLTICTTVGLPVCRRRTASSSRQWVASAIASGHRQALSLFLVLLHIPQFRGLPCFGMEKKWGTQKGDILMVIFGTIKLDVTSQSANARSVPVQATTRATPAPMIASADLLFYCCFPSNRIAGK